MRVCAIYHPIMELPEPRLLTQMHPVYSSPLATLLHTVLFPTPPHLPPYYFACPTKFPHVSARQLAWQILAYCGIPLHGVSFLYARRNMWLFTFVILHAVQQTFALGHLVNCPQNYMYLAIFVKAQWISSCFYAKEYLTILDRKSVV